MFFVRICGLVFCFSSEHYVKVVLYCQLTSPATNIFLKDKPRHYLAIKAAICDSGHGDVTSPTCTVCEQVGVHSRPVRINTL